MRQNFLVILTILFILTVSQVNAQVDRAFVERISFNVNGNIELVGNVLITCDGTGNCANVQNGTTSGNNGRQMAYVNIDAAAGFSNSSSADLALPAGSTVLYAGLYWGGRAVDGDANRESIQIKTPGAATYITVNSTVIDTFANDGDVGSRPYQAFAEITSLVLAAGNGSYFVGDLTAAIGNDGLGFYGGWSMTVIYEDMNQVFRRLVVFDGAARVTGTDTISITVTDLLTPLSGSFETFIGAMVWEGDEAISGDAFVFESTTINQTLNPATNFWNSSITNQNVRVTTKSPDFVNQLAMDLDFVDVSGLLPNAATTADIDFVTGGDWYYPNYLAFVTELYLPDFGSTMSKTAVDINGGTVLPNDEVEYTISFSNAGQDGATNTVLTDFIPTNMTYVANSLEIVSADIGPSGAMTDAASDAAEFDAVENKVVFRLGDGADENNGGTFLNSQGATVRFRVTINDLTPAGDIINTASITSNSFIFPVDEFTVTDDETITVILSPSLIVSKVATITTDNGNPDTVDENDVITFSIAVENTGNVDLTSLQVNDTMGGLLTCLPTTLAPGDSVSCTDYTYTVLASDVTIGGFINNTATATAFDTSLNTISGDDSTATAITLDTPIITSPIDGALLNDSIPNVAGTAIPGSLITVTGPLGETCTTITDGSGNWSCDLSPALAEGSNQIDVVASDGGINTSPTASITIDIDTQAPSAPVITTPTNGAPVSGTGEVGATVTVTTPSGATCSALVQANGTWFCTLVPSPVDGEDITAEQTDPAGNTSLPVTVVDGVDTSAPDAPIVTSPSDGDLSNNNTPSVTGTAEPGSTVVVTGPNGETCSSVVDANGDWSCNIDPALADGANQLDVVATDPAGNDSATTSLILTIDTQAPSAPVITAPTNGAPVSGTGEIGATVTVITPSGATCSSVVQANGTWSCTLAPSPVDGEAISAEQTDPAGNTSLPVTVVDGVDTSPPAAPVIVLPIDGISTNDSTPTVSGTGEPGSLITVTVSPNGESCTTTVDAVGNWSCTLPVLQNGSNVITAIAADTAGNQSTPDSVSINILSGTAYGLTVNTAAELVTTEMGGTDAFEVLLPLTPTADVTFNLSSNNTDEGTVAPSNVTFTPSNWDQPITITVTGVDDSDYDLDQNYHIIISALSSSDSNYDGINPDDVDAVNIDDDESPDLSAFITNCVAGVLPNSSPEYHLIIANNGNKDISDAIVVTVFPSELNAPTWDCANVGGSSCGGASGTGDLSELVDLPVGSEVIYTFSTQTIGNLHDFIDVEGSVTMPIGETDVNPNDNNASDSDLIYQFIFKDSFECVAPGTVG